MIETINRVNINGFRHYEVKKDNEVIGVYPSVTSILGETADKEWLENWKNRVGEDVANQISKDATDRGTVMHRLCELYLNLPLSLSKEERLNETLAISRLDDEIDQFDNRAKIVGGSLFYNYIRANTFYDIAKVLYQEKFVWTKRNGGYAGTLDNLSQLITGEYAIIDFKTARKPKSEKDIEDYKLQVAAYAVAVWDRFKIKVSLCKILISSETDHTPQIYTMSSNDIAKYYKKFKLRVQKFYEMHPIN
ncbi:MAG: PD-(D/E)XK nuclease family protein [Bacilli bacterium]